MQEKEEGILSIRKGEEGLEQGCNFRQGIQVEMMFD